ncbi:ribonuclease Z [Bacillota bacterium Meth-B3]|nr:ribonuclease Z [Christensenellaceae bacterium]
MLEICVLGTGAMMPLPERRLAALAVRLDGRLMLIDCGEGTQLAVRASGWSFKRIDAICLTHFHADHVAGLPGLLLTMGASGRTDPVRVIGPRGLNQVVAGLRVIAPELPFALELEEMDAPVFEAAFGTARLTGFALEHVIPCYGYALELGRPGRFDPARARALGVPVTSWKQLQAGHSVEVAGRAYAPDMVLGPARRGLKLAYCTDTRPTPSIIEYARDADLLICEGTYADPDKADKAAQYGHMTFADAANLAARARAKGLLLTHFSPAIADPHSDLPAARAIFERTEAARDGRHLVLRFEDVV